MSKRPSLYKSSKELLKNGFDNDKIRSTVKRVQALKQLGMTDEQLARIHAPIRLDVGAVRPDEIALSIMAEMIAVRHGLDTGHIRSLSAHG